MPGGYNPLVPRRPQYLFATHNNGNRGDAELAVHKTKIFAHFARISVLLKRAPLEKGAGGCNFVPTNNHPAVNRYVPFRDCPVGTNHPAASAGEFLSI